MNMSSDLTEKMLRSIAYFTRELKPELCINKSDCPTHDDWLAKDKPALWSVVERYKDFTVALDTGYGYLALFKGEDAVGYGKREIIGLEQDIIVLEKSYYGTKQYIFVPAKA